MVQRGFRRPGRRQFLGAVGAAALATLVGCADADGTAGRQSSQAPPATGRSGGSRPPDTGTTDPAGPSGVYAALSSGAERRAGGASAATTQRALAGFGLAMLHQVSGDASNTVISPYSLYSVLAMVRAGAQGETAEQLDDALRVPGIEKQGAVITTVDDAIRAAMDTAADDTVMVAGANQIWVQEGLGVRDQYLDALARQYGVKAVAAAFAAAPERVRRAINGWVAERTNDLIPELFGAGDIDAGTQLALVNALYLKAGWQLPMTLADGVHEFTTGTGEIVKTPMMSTPGPVPGVVGDGWTAVSVPYRGNALAMTLLVPEAGRYSAIVDAADSDLLVRATAGSRSDPKQVAVTMPPFTTTSTPDALAAAHALGITDAFDGSRADLSAITGHRGLFVSALVHQAVISVDENGTEAAAATGAAMTASAPVVDVSLAIDRPFLYWIADTTTGAPLFIGTVTDPHT